MSWYKATVNHERMKAGNVYWLEDDWWTRVKLDKGYLEPADEPEWNRELEEDAQWPRSSSTTTEPSQ